MSIFIETRALLPSHLFRSSVLAWRCSLCNKMFCISPDEAETWQRITAPPYVEQAFRVHNCAIVLVERGELRRAHARIGNSKE